MADLWKMYKMIIPAGFILLFIAVVEYMNLVCCLINNFTKTVIPAEAGLRLIENPEP